MKGLFRKGSFRGFFAVFVAAVSAVSVDGQTNLPVVKVTTSVASLTEGAGTFGSLTFSSTRNNGVELELEFSGGASARDFYIYGVPDNTIVTTLPTRLAIPAGRFNTTLQFQALSDAWIEGTESLSVRIVPKATYQIGSPAAASFVVMDRTQFSTNKGPALGFYPRGGNLEWKPTLPFSVGAGGIQTLDLRLMVDNEVVDQVLAASPPATNVFTLNWSNPTLGAHIVQFVAFDERGGSAASPPAEINVVSDIVEPARTFTLALPQGYFVNTKVNIYNGTAPAEHRGFVEFDVPAAATNMEAVFQFGGRVSERVDLFAYAAGPTNFTEVISLPREHIGSVFTNSGAMPVQIDVTPWVRQFAGEKLGIIFAIPELATTYYAGSTWTNFTLLLQHPAEMDAGPHIRWMPGTPRIAPGTNVTIQVQISDADSHITRVHLFDGDFAVAVDAPATPYPPGTNIVTFNVNLTPGMHTLSAHAASAGKVALSEQRLVFVSTNQNILERRWLGSHGWSASFYVLDAAGRAFVWGLNIYAQLGLGFKNTHSDYGVKHPVTLLAPDGLKFQQIASAGHFAVGLMNDGSLYLWGTNRLSPMRVEFPDGVAGFQSVAARNGGPVAVDQSRGVWSLDVGTGRWMRRTQTGSNVKAGAGASAISYRSAQIMNMIIWNSSVVSGVEHAPTSGDVYVISAEGELNRWTAGASTPVRFTANGVASWREVAASDNYVLAIDEQGRLWSWDRGFFAFRQTTEGVLVPLPAEVTNVVEIAATSKIAMLLTDKGEVYAWGEAAPGVWADLNARTAFVPEKVNGLPNLFDANATEVAAAFVVTEDGSNGVEFKLAAPAGTIVPIEVSEDLEYWTSYTNLVMKSGVTTISLPSDPTGKRFFRVAP